MYESVHHFRIRFHKYCFLFTKAQTKTEAYIAKYSSIAIEEMNRHNIPASITLAQGILESGSGESRLASEGNNHFGIKCHDNWNGETIIEDDDETISSDRRTFPGRVRCDLLSGRRYRSD